jgi:hypothetical protein
MPRNDREAPLHPTAPTKQKRLKTKVINRWKPPQYIEGIGHQVAGVKRLQQKKRTGGADWKLVTEPNSGRHSEAVFKDVQKDKNADFNEAQKTKYEQGIADYKANQKKRKRIPTLPDPDAKKYRLEREQAKARMRGVLGTFLSGPVGLG